MHFWFSSAIITLGYTANIHAIVLNFTTLHSQNICRYNHNKNCAVKNILFIITILKIQNTNQNLQIWQTIITRARPITSQSRARYNTANQKANYVNSGDPSRTGFAICPNLKCMTLNHLSFPGVVDIHWKLVWQ